nr:MAG TPA_asm: hypothetical protein [Microviridae sp.]
MKTFLYYVILICVTLCILEFTLSYVFRGLI